jgi:malonyl-CoA O-methyltransferase
MIRTKKAAKAKVAHYFASQVKTYDAWADVQINAATQLVEQLKKIPSPQTILEIGCGTGLVTEKFLPLFPSAAVLLTDIAHTMVKHCQNKYANRGQNIYYAQMDGEELALQQSFDLIISGMTFQWFHPIQKSLQQLYQQITPDGNLVFSLLGSKSLQEWRDTFSLFNINDSGPDLPTIAEIQSIDSHIQLHVEYVKQPYRSAAHFLKTLKYLGAASPHESHKTLSAGHLRRILRHLDQLFEDRLIITYEVIYGLWNKTS